MEKIKLRVWDNKLLNEAYVVAEQIRAHIESLIQQMPPTADIDLPHSMVPTEVLYELVVCNNMMYNILLDKDLIDTGNKKTDRNKNH